MLPRRHAVPVFYAQTICENSRKVTLYRRKSPAYTPPSSLSQECGAQLEKIVAMCPPERAGWLENSPETRGREP